MARTAKKETALTAEEKLAQALVPEAEQPYKVPENWCWAKVGALAEILNGYAFKSEKYVENGIRIIRIANVQDGYIEDEKPVFYPFSFEREIEKFILRENDLLISLTGNVGRVAFLNASLLPAALNQRVGCLRVRNQTTLSISFLYYSLLRREFQDSCTKNSKGSAQLNMSTEWLKEQPVPLPPLAEQQRIVVRIENLFAKLDEAKEKAQAVVDGFVDRKAAILHKAFTGVLTAGWREDNSISDSSWDKKRIDQISHPRAGYAFDSKKFTDHGFQIVRMGNLYGGSLDLSRSPVFISPEDIEEKAMNRSLINDGDILITLTGTKYKRDYGYAVCVRGQKDLLVNQRILCLSPKETVITNYLLYYLQSNIFRDIFFSNETGGVNQGNVSSKFVEGIEIALPPIKEQQKIVEILDRVFEKETIALEAAEQVIDQIDTMKKAILARAFRGELGTNDPADESAVELLKRVQS